MKGLSKIFCALACIITCVSIQRASIAHDVLPRVVANWTGGTNASGAVYEVINAELSGTTVFVIERVGTAGALAAVDLSNPLSPALIARVDLPRAPSDLAISGNRAYVHTINYDLRIFDITVPQNIQQIGSTQISANLYSLTVAGTTAYLRGWNTPIYIIDCANPADPRLIGLKEIFAEVRDLLVKDNLLIIPTYGDGIYFLNLTNAAGPTVISHLTSNRYFHNVAIKGNFLYSSEDTQGLLIIDVSDPLRPKTIGKLPSAGGEVRVYGNNLYVEGPLKIFDLTNPVSPQQTLGSPYIAGNIFGRVDDLLLSASSALSVTDLASPANPQRLIADIPTAAAADIAVDGRYAYVASSTGAVQIIDIPSRTVIAQTGVAARRIFKEGRHLYTADPTFQIIDVADPTAPVVKTTMPNISAVAVAEKRGFVAAAGANGFTVLSLTNKAAPTVIGQGGGPAYVYTTDISGNFIYAATGWGIGIFDISNPAAVRLVTNTFGFTTDHEWDIKVRGNYLYSAGSAGLVVLDISNPYAPQTITNVYGGFLRRLWINGDYAYALDHLGSLRIFDISDPKHPAQVSGNISVNGAGLFAGDTLYIAGSNGFSICDLFLPDPAALRIRALNPYSDGVSRLRINAAPGAQFKIERTADFKTWTPWHEDTIGETAFDVADPNSGAVNFYRVSTP